MIANSTPLSDLIDIRRYRIADDSFRRQCKQELDRQGVLVLPDFLNQTIVQSIAQEGRDHAHLAYYTKNQHNVFLTDPDPAYDSTHARNALVKSSKGCITTDQIPVTSNLHTLYHSAEFKSFLCDVLGENALHEYKDTLSSINLHYASAGQELGWHFDNSSFAITLLIQKPESGGVFEYVRDVRDADTNDMNYTRVDAIVNGREQPKALDMDAGTLVLFRGRNSIHRVTPTIGNTTRMLVVLAYNSEPGISLSESARMTFYGRLQ